MTARYMSTTYSAPSGPVSRLTGRNQASGVAKNSLPGCGGFEVKLTPSAREHLAMHQAAGRLADEGIAKVFGLQGVAAIYLDAAGRRELSGVQIRSGPSAGQRKDVRLLTLRRDVGQHARHGQEWIAGQVSIFQHDVLQRGPIVADESVAEIVERQAELAIARNRLAIAGERIKTKVHAADRERLLRGPAQVDNRAAAQAVGDINAVVEAESRVIGPQLRVFGRETAKPNFLSVGPAVAIGVLADKRLARPA